MRTIITAFLLAATLVLAQSEKVAIIPVTAWPKVLNLPDKQIVNASVSDCVKAGYRLLPAKPSAPTGKQIKTETIIQDPDDPTKCKYEIVYEDIPAPPTPPPVIPEVLTNVVIGRLSFAFSTNGWWRGVTWLDAPKTNAAGKE